MNHRQDFFAALNAFFEKIYVITLERATDRHQHLRNELDGLRYDLFFGKDKQNFSVEQLKQEGLYNEALARKHHRYGKAMQGGQIGCAWSHADVYRHVVENGYKRVLILEDDVVIDEEAAKRFPAMLNQLPPDWELLYFGFAQKEKAPPGAIFTQVFYHLLRTVGAFPYSHKTINRLYPKKMSTHVYRAGYHDCTHAYAVTATAAQKLLALQQPLSYVADNLLAHAVTNGTVNGYILLPRLINQQYQVGIGSASYLNN